MVLSFTTKLKPGLIVTTDDSFLDEAYNLGKKKKIDSAEHHVLFLGNSNTHHAPASTNLVADPFGNLTEECAPHAKIVITSGGLKADRTSIIQKPQWKKSLKLTIQNVNDTALRVVKKIYTQFWTVTFRVIETASQQELVEAITNSHCYVHTSYIDNSPNSLCEAQILGAPVLATHVGGISSLVNHGVSGLLFPANDPYTLASLLKRMASDRPLAEKIGEGARKEALHRHDSENIKNTLVKIYKEILIQ